MEEYKKIDSDTIEITTTFIRIEDKKHLLEEKQRLENDIAQIEIEIAKIDIKLETLEK